MGIDITSYLLGKQAGGGGGDEPTGTVEITSNGSHNVKQYATADVNVPSVTPTGNINITNMQSTDVSAYATAQVVDADLIASNIKKDVDILGVVGTYEGGGGDEPVLYKYVNELYQMNSTGLICHLAHREFTKPYSDPALVAYYYDGRYEGPILLSKTENGAKYYAVYDDKEVSPSLITIGGESWYASGTQYFSSSGDLTSSDGVALKLEGTIASHDEAAEKLLHISSVITKSGNYNIPSGYDGFDSFVVDVGEDVAPISFPDYVKLGGGYIELPYTVNANYKITVDFDALTYSSNQAVIGNSSGSNYVHLTQYSNKWYTSKGSSEANFSKATTGRHTYIVNKNGYNYFDDEAVVDYTPTDNSAKLWVGGRNGAGGKFGGKLYSYKIESIATGDTICELVPFKVEYNGATLSAGMYDTVAKVAYATPSATTGYDE